MYKIKTAWNLLNLTLLLIKCHGHSVFDDVARETRPGLSSNANDNAKFEAETRLEQAYENELIREIKELMKDIRQDQTERYDSFNDMNLKSELLRGIYEFGYKKPSTLQQKVIPCHQGQDCTIQASGTDKTAAFAISILQQLDVKNPECQAIVLVPTSGLALRVEEIIEILGAYINVKTSSLRGDPANLPRLSHGAQVVVGTPRQMLEIISRMVLSTSSIRMVILDEADEIFLRGFQHEINAIMTFLNMDKQVILTSSQMFQEVLKFAELYMQNPTRIYER